MRLKELKNEIIKENKAKIARIMKEADEEIKKIKQSADDEIKAYKKKKEENFKAFSEDLRLKYSEMAELDGQKLIQEAKQRAIDMLFNEIRLMFKNMPKNQRKELVYSMLNNAGKEIEIDKVFVNKEDISFVKEKGYNAEAYDIIGGIIAENNGRTIRVDYSIDTIINEFRKNSLGKAAEILFIG